MKPLMVFIVIIFSSLMSLAGTELRLAQETVQTRELESSSIGKESTERLDYVVQFTRIIQENDKLALEKKGAQIFRYLPDDALVVRANQNQLKEFAAENGHVNAFVQFQPKWRVSEFLPVISSFLIGKKEVILVTTFSDADRRHLESQVKRLDSSSRILDSEDKYLTILMELTKIPALSQLTGIEFIQKVEPMNSLHMVLDQNEVGISQDADYGILTGDETGTKVMNFESAWGLGFHGEGQIVSMADTGLDSGDVNRMADDFVGAIRSGYIFGIGAKDWSDPMGHGTHVAGSIVGRGTASGGKIRGGAFASQIVPEGMWSPILDNLSVPPQLNKLFEAANKDGARVHSNSWGAATNFGVYEAMAQKVDDYMWNNPEFLILFAAGNSGVDKDKDGKIDANSVGTPGTAKNCITVGASENVTSTGGIQVTVSQLRTAKDSWPAEPIWSSKISDDKNGVAMFSSRGPVKDRRLKPDIMAPGTNILSNRSHVKDSNPLWGAFGDHYAWSGGTSMATPLTAGAAAVTRQMLIEKYHMGSPSAALIKAVILHTAHDMYPGQYGEGTSTQELSHRPNNDEGYGLVDMKALAQLTAATTMVDEKAGVAQGAKLSYTATVKQGGSLSINLVYTDAPGSPTAAKTLVNNLDLFVVDAQGQEISSNDSTNNHELIELKNLSAGTYKIEVRGANVPMGKNGKQPFSLVYSSL
jgi:serine protease AprX